MKTTFKILGALLALGAVALLGLHLFLRFGLTQAMNETVLPRIKSDYGLDVAVGGLSLNLPAGTLSLKDVQIRNPEGFVLENLATVGRVEVKLDLLSLLGQDPIVVKNVDVERLRINLVRNEHGEFNVLALRETLSPPAAAKGKGVQVPPQAPSREAKPGGRPTAPAPQPETREVGPLPEVLLENLAFRAKLHYLDFKLNNLDLTLDLALTGENLSTLRGADAPWGALLLWGSVGSERSRFVTDLRAKVAPLLDPQNPSFDLKGKVMEIDPRILGKVFEKLGIRSDPFGIEPEIHCRDGAFKDSFLRLELKQVELGGKVSKHLGGPATIGTLRVSVPLGGTLQSPRFDVQEALASAVADNAHEVVSSLLSGVVAQKAGVTNGVSSNLTDAAVEVAADKVKKIGKSEATQKELAELAKSLGGETNSAATSAPPSDVLIDVLGEHVDEIGENEELKKELKGIGHLLFGK